VCQLAIEIGVKLAVDGNPIIKIVPNAVQFDEADALEKGNLCYARPLVGVRIGFPERLLFDSARKQFEKPESTEAKPDYR
jgi:hypothetical protein